MISANISAETFQSGWICIFSSYIFICFRAAVMLIVETVSQILIGLREGGGIGKPFLLGGRKSGILTQSEVSFYWHCYADNTLRFVLRVQKSSLRSSGSRLVTLHKYHVISIQGREQILADKSWLNHFKNSRPFVFVLLWVWQVSPLSRAGLWMKGAYNTAQTQWNTLRRGGEKPRVKVTLASRFHRFCFPSEFDFTSSSLLDSLI